MIKKLFFFLSFISITAFGENLDSLVNDCVLKPISNEAVDYGNELVLKLSDAQWPNTVAFAKANLSIAKQLKYKEGVAKSTSRLGWAWDFMGNGDSAVYYYKQSIELYKDLDDLQSVADNTNNIGVSYYYYGNHTKALEYYKQTVDCYLNINDTIGLGRVYNNLGLLNNRLNNPEQAIFYLQKSKELKIAIKDSLGLLNTLSNIALSYQYNKQFTESIEYSEKTIALAEVLQNEYAITSEEANMALTYKEMGDFSKAEKLYLMAIVKLEEYARFEDLIRVYTNISNMYKEAGDFERALVYLNKCLAMDLTPYTELKIFRIIEDTYFKMGRLKKAYEYSRQIKAIEDSIHISEQNKLIAELTDNFITDSTIASEKLTAELEKEKRKQSEIVVQKEKKLNQYLTLLIVFFALVLGLIVYFYFGKIKTEKTLHSKNKQIQESLKQNELLVKEVHHRVKNNLQVISSLLRLQSRNLEDSESIKVMQDAQDRVNSMAILHKKLYQNDQITEINVRDYLAELAQQLKESHQKPDSDILYQLDIADVRLDVDSVIPIGLIVNELLLNSFKYAYENGKQLNIELKIQLIEKDLILVFKDDGSKIKNTDELSKSKSFGLKLIESLALKFKSKPEFKIENGLRVDIVLKNAKNLNNES